MIDDIFNRNVSLGASNTFVATVEPQLYILFLEVRMHLFSRSIFALVCMSVVFTKASALFTNHFFALVALKWSFGEFITELARVIFVLFDQLFVERHNYLFELQIIN